MKLLCIMSQNEIARARLPGGPMADGLLARMMESHVARCAGCRSFEMDLDRLAHALTFQRTDGRQPAQSSSGFVEGVWRKIDATRHAQSAWRQHLGRLTLAGSTAFAAICGVLVMQGGIPSGLQSTQHQYVGVSTQSPTGDALHSVQQRPVETAAVAQRGSGDVIAPFGKVHLQAAPPAIRAAHTDSAVAVVKAPRIAAMQVAVVPVSAPAAKAVFAIDEKIAPSPPSARLEAPVVHVEIASGPVTDGDVRLAAGNVVASKPAGSPVDYASIGSYYESAGQYDDAANAYVQAYAQSKDPDLAYAAGRAAEKAGDQSMAFEYYSRFLGDNAANGANKPAERSTKGTQQCSEDYRA